MEDTLSKYIRLFAFLLLTAIGVIALLALLLMLLKAFYGIVDSFSAFTYAYKLLIMSLPMIILTSAFVVFIQRVSFHPVRWVRFISRLLSMAVIGMMAYFYVLDLISFYHNQANTPASVYSSYDLTFLTISIGTLFLLGVLQALTLPTEKDWMERGNV